jgi:hypothetical protein
LLEEVSVPLKSSASNISVFEGSVAQMSIRSERGNEERIVPSLFGGSRSYGQNVQILIFRLEITDGHGNTVGRKVVELRGESISGSICDGDTVEVTGVETKTGIRQPQRVLNLTTGKDIIATQPGSTSSDFVKILFALLISLLGIIIAVPILASIGNGSSHPVIVLIRFILVGCVGYLAYRFSMWITQWIE